jgi:hypothetical protein
VPSVGDDSTNTALVEFVPRTPKYVDPLLGEVENTLIDTPLGDLSFKKTFYGLTQLYAAAAGERIVAEWVDTPTVGWTCCTDGPCLPHRGYGAGWTCIRLLVKQRFIGQDVAT